MKTILISRSGLEILQKDLKNLEEEIKNTHQRMGESARGDSILAENPEYQELRVKAMYDLPRKKAEILERLKCSKIIEETMEYQNFDGTIIPGTKVTFAFEGQKPKTMCILGEMESDFENNKMSYQAPISQAIIGKKSNEKVQFRGSIITILSVERI